MSNKNLDFYWRMGDYALEACDEHLVHDEANCTIELNKYYKRQGREFRYVIGYFWFDSHEGIWELKFVGDRFKEVRETDIVKLFEMLACAYDALQKWACPDEEVDQWA